MLFAALRRATVVHDSACFPLRGPRGIFLEGLLKLFPITRELSRVIKTGYLSCHCIGESWMVLDFSASISCGGGTLKSRLGDQSFWLRH